MSPEKAHLFFERLDLFFAPVRMKTVDQETSFNF